MSTPLSKLIHGQAELRTKLKEHGISNSDQLLAAAKTTAGRKDLSDQLKIDHTHILTLANCADLARVRGIGGIYSKLLEEAGVDTVKELAARNSDNLQSNLQALVVKQPEYKRAPSLDVVRNWVSQAKALPKIIEY